MDKTGRKIILLLLGTCLLNPMDAAAQEIDMNFMQFLLNSGRYQQVIDLSSFEENEIPEKQRDSIYYFTGLAHYYLKEIQPSIHAWQNVSSRSELAIPAGLFGSWNQAYSGDYHRAGQWLHSLKPKDSLELKLIGFESLGLMLLERDYDSFSSLRDKVDASFYTWAVPLSNFDQYMKELSSFRKKSTWVAGLSSALIPGLGKIYAGNIGAGISSFLVCGTLGAITVENGLKSGWTHWSTLVFGTLFTLFYTGNIYGSIINIRHYREDFYSDMDQRILWDMHTPIRDTYH